VRLHSTVGLLQLQRLGHWPHQLSTVGLKRCCPTVVHKSVHDCFTHYYGYCMQARIVPSVIVLSSKRVPSETVGTWYPYLYKGAFVPLYIEPSMRYNSTPEYPGTKVLGTPTGCMYD